jgi:ubiquitin-protein ligase
VWHPNIDDDSGNVCVDFATGFAATRSGQPVLVGERVSSLSAILVGLQMLLRTPNPLNSLNYHAGEQMNRDPAAFKVQAREWTARYAGSSQPDSAAQ